MIIQWTIDKYRFTCEVEYWPSDGSKARAYWNYGTDKKFGGPGKSGYFIEIKMVPQDYWLSKKIHGWIRLVRPFKGPFGPGNIDQFWQTGKTGEEEKILFEVRDCLQAELSGNAYSKERHRTSQHDRVPTNVFSDFKELERYSRAIGADVERKEIEDIFKAKGFSGKKLEMIVNKKLKQKGKNRQRSSTKKRKERQKIPTRKAAPKKAIAIVFVAVIIAAVFVLGNGEISLPDISFPDITGSCETIQALRITSEATQGKISLQLCKEMGKDVLTVSGELDKSAQVNLTLFNPDIIKIEPDYTFVSKKFSRVIEQDVYENDYGKWRIKITINGEYRGDVLYFDIVKP